ncbi:hypothetical protein [Arthrobacter sp. NEB 688]|uniref:hypothetical protein n=1 Tax=Arthrobacter sp. NEB 688 TaxID=904039 RepID=UPI0015657602|nr:hypothetical protein [Arthrobacter sp. NEB 688]QKE83218.1 hypothetical protein HL663_04185 [Arthrobacter sp. NEB 688]
MARDRHPAAPLPARLLTALGGRRGARAPAAAGGVAALAPVVALLALPVGVAALRQAACAATGWEGRTPVWRQCASPLLAGTGEADLPLLRRLATGFLEAAAPGVGLAQQRWVLVLWTVAAALLLAALVVLVGTARRHPLADPLPLALSPVLALAVLTSVDLVPVTCSVLAVWLWSREREVAAGALAGVAVLGGPLALVPLLGMVLVDRRPAARRRLLAAAGVAVLLVVGPAAALEPGLLGRPVAAWWAGGAGAGSSWFVPSLVDRPLAGPVVAGLALLGMLLAAVLAVLLLRHRARPPVADVVVLALVVALVTAPALPASAGLWLLPFLALAGVPWRDQLLWAGAEVAHAVALFAWTAAAADPGLGLPAGWYATALALRLVALGRLGWVVWARAAWGVGPAGPPRADWDAGPRPGRLERLPAGHPVDEPRGAVGDTAYPPVTERP